MWKRHIYYIILAAVVLFALLLRVYKIQVIPPALTWDEVSIGYNAYSILKTGRDEHGRLFPLDSFIAYGDYKPPLAVYATIPFIAVFGLNEFSVRLPSAIFGTMTVLLTFVLVLELFKNHNDSTKGKLIGLLSAAILTISPWHLNLSRAGFEANIALFFIVLGILLALRAMSNPAYWPFTWIPFVLSIYTFNSSRYFSIIMGIALIAMSYKHIQKNFKMFISGIVIAAVLLLPIIPHLLSKEARLRFAEVNIFTDASIVQTSNERIEREHNSIISKIINNRRVGYARSYLLHFFDNLQPDFLFGKGDGNPKFSIQDVGQLYTFEAVFFLIGVFWIFSEFPQVGLFLMFWIVAAILPAAVARETPHALRILNSLPTWHIFIACGIVAILEMTKKQQIVRQFLLGSIVCLYVFHAGYYLHSYYRHYAKEFSGEWQYGYKQALTAISPIERAYKSVVISENIGRAYMYTLFYEKIDPDILFKSVDAYTDSAGFYHVLGFAHYRFGGSLETIKPNTLYVWDSGSIPKGVRIIKTINLLNGNPVLVLFDDGGARI